MVQAVIRRPLTAQYRLIVPTVYRRRQTSNRGTLGPASTPEPQLLYRGMQPINSVPLDNGQTSADVTLTADMPRLTVSLTSVVKLCEQFGSADHFFCNCGWVKGGY
jgi:hypothetical protein